MLPRPVFASISVSLFRFVHHPQKSKESLPDSHIILIPWNCSENTRKGMKEIKKNSPACLAKCAPHMLDICKTILRSYDLSSSSLSCVCTPRHDHQLFSGLPVPFVCSHLLLMIFYGISNSQFAFACFLFLI